MSPNPSTPSTTTQRRILSALASVSLLCATAGAEIVIGNLPAANDLTLSALDSTRVKALAFTMPSGSDYRLDSVTVRLGDYDVGETLLVQLREDAGGADPSSNVHASFTAPAGQGAGNFDYLLTSSSSVTLAADTKYWLYVSSVSGSFGFRASSPGITPTGIATLTGNRFSSNGGASFSNSSILNSFQIDATAIPEPASAATWMGLVAFALCSPLARRPKRS